MASSHHLLQSTISNNPSYPFHQTLKTPKLAILLKTQTPTKPTTKFQITASNDTNNNGSDSFSYLQMWKKAIDRQQKEIKFDKISQNLPSPIHTEVETDNHEALAKKSFEFQKILEVSKEERDRVQRIQVIDRAAAAIAAARALLKDRKPTSNAKATSLGSADSALANNRVQSDNNAVLSSDNHNGGIDSRSFHMPPSRNSGSGPPGPDFWSWTPPTEDDSSGLDVYNVKKAPISSGKQYLTNKLMEKEKASDFLSIPMESTNLESNLIAPLPPFQSLMEVHKVEALNTSQEAPVKEDIGAQFSAHAAEAAHALHNVEEKPSYGVNPDGSRWWKETGVETRPDGVVCRWTLNRGVSSDGVVEWEEKYWEAADEYGYKELGSEKSGRDATGNVWHEYWKESMWQEHGLLHMEKTADKWGKNANGDEWQEKWWEHYDASGKADKWAHKWCSLNPNTQVEVGHAHVWHERWGEKYDGQGGSTKYTDKWAERWEGDAWVKWGDKWDENFDQNYNGVKQGETWWEGKYGDRWNRTWGEQHNGSGWVHKYGKSSSGEHWDTYVPEDTWYERFPHYGFLHCFENSVQLREV
ncbi:protein LIKE EARLY STARVATION, chloroplastic [Amaranthus tricolor]|uniref:protein LIKE EARLY STARVATION, chloroplastic n=1 Tax=Amaranthus tricolor TaxID=29722 RepID=UPI00258A5069|nr:protein LIKE EARLY STARVATION, chloroplastic [Amaranthus tricolor]